MFDYYIRNRLTMAQAKIYGSLALILMMVVLPTLAGYNFGAEAAFPNALIALVLYYSLSKVIGRPDVSITAGLSTFVAGVIGIALAGQTMGALIFSILITALGAVFVILAWVKYVHDSWAS